MVLISDCFFRLWSLQLPHPKRQNRPLKREGSCLLEVRLSPSGPICSLKEGSAMLDLECKEAKLLWLWRPRGRSVCSTTWSLIPSWRSKIIKNKLKRRNMDLTQMPPASACNNNKCIPNNSESFHLEFDPLNLKLHFSGNTHLFENWEQFWHSIYIRILISLLIQFKLVHGPFGQGKIRLLANFTIHLISAPELSGRKYKRSYEITVLIMWVLWKSHKMYFFFFFLVKCWMGTRVSPIHKKTKLNVHL